MSQQETVNHSSAILLAGTALLIIFAMIGYFLGFDSGRDANANSSAIRFDVEAPSSIATTCRSADHTATQACMERLLRSSFANDRAERDSATQAKTAEWGKWMLAVSVFSLFVTGGGIWFVWITFRETRHSNVIAREELESAKTGLRPWLDFELAGLKITQSSGNPLGLPLVDIDPKLNISNDGKSPAIRIGLHVDLCQGQRYNPGEGVLSLIERGKHWPVSIRSAIFPGKSWPCNDTSFILDAALIHDLDPEPAVSMWVTIGINYTDSHGTPMFTCKVYVGLASDVWLHPADCVHSFKELTYATNYT